MNCTCIRDLEDKMRIEAVEKIPSLKGADIELVEAGNTCFVDINGKLKFGLYIPVTIYHRPIGRKKKTELKVIASFCPICGKPTSKETEE